MNNKCGFNDEEFINEILLPLFHGSIDKPMISLIYDLNGKVITATDSIAQLWSLVKGKELIGKTIAEIFPVQEYGNLTQGLSDIRQEVIEQEKMVNYVCFIPKKEHLATIISHHFPIFTPDGRVIASQVVVNYSNILNNSLLLKQQFISVTKYAKNSINLKNIKLTLKQEQILFLITLGFSQREAADYLGIARGTVAKVLSKQICPAFDISGSNTNLLIHKVITSKYFQTIPEFFLQAKVVKINQDSGIFASFTF